MFVNVYCRFSALWFLNQICLWPIFNFCIISDGTSVMVIIFLETKVGRKNIVVFLLICLIIEAMFLLSFVAEKIWRTRFSNIYEKPR